MMFAGARTRDDGVTRVVWLGHHHSRHVRTPDGWKISYRRNTVDLPAALEEIARAAFASHGLPAPGAGAWDPVPFW